MNIFQLILLINFAAFLLFFTGGMFFLKASGINPVGKRRRIKNKSGFISLLLSTLILLILWVMYIINTNTASLFFSVEFIIKSDFAKWAAAAIMTAATIIEIISGLTLGKSGRIYSPTEETKLIKNGIYGIVRNPIVSGMFLYGFSILLLNPNVSGLLMIILLFYGYNTKVDNEAEKLEEMFGNNWHIYCRTVGKYFPKLSRKSRIQ